jgi:sulfonate transport system substrate-binding protein
MSGSEKVQPVEIWYTRCGGATASTIAIRRGFLQEKFSDGSVRLQSLLDSNDGTVRESHFDHSIKSLFREGGNIPPIWARSKGQDTVTIGITWVDEYQAVVARRDSDIREIGDLKGKRLAVPLYEGISIDFMRGAAFHGFANALSLAGLGRDDVTFVDTVIPHRGGFELSDRPSGTAELEALAQGSVDAVFLRQSTGFRLARDHAHELATLVRLDAHPDPEKRVNNGSPRPVTVHREFLDQHPDLVVRYLGVLLRSAAWAMANPVNAIETIAAESRGADVDIIAAAYPKLATSLSPDLGPAYVDGLEAQKKFLRDWGFLVADFEVRDWIVEEPLARARELVAREGLIAA